MPENLLLDTGIVSAFLKPAEPHETRRQAVESRIRGNIGLISFITIAELYYWAEKYSWGPARRQELDSRIKNYLVLDPTRDTADIWAKTKRTCELKGRVLGAHDLWIASSALEYDVTLLTTDRDFSAIPQLKHEKF